MAIGRAAGTVGLHDPGTSVTGLLAGRCAPIGAGADHPVHPYP